MKKLFLTLFLLLPLAMFAQSPLSGNYAKVVQTDSLGYQVVRLSAPALNMRLRELSVSFGSGSSCVLLNSNNEEVFSVPFPPTEEFIEMVTQMVVSNGGNPVSAGRIRAMFKRKEVSKNNYDLTQQVPEDDWDY